MTLILDKSKPEGLEVKTYNQTQHIYLEDYEIDMEDFLYMCFYVLTNTDLKKDDPRCRFVECIKHMKKVPGYNYKGIRLDSDTNDFRVF